MKQHARIFFNVVELLLFEFCNWNMIKKLINLKLETKAEVIALDCTNQLVLNYLSSIGIVLGAKVMVMSKGLLGGNPCAVLIDNNENMVMLRASEAGLVVVREML